MKTTPISTTTFNPQMLLSIGAFILIFTIVHLFYEGFIRPTALAAVAAEGTAAAKNIWVILKDGEQQACITLGIYCLFLMGYKTLRIQKEESLFTTNFLAVGNNANKDSDEPLDLDAALSTLEQSKYKESAAFSTWITCIKRYKNTNNVQHAADSIKSNVESIEAQLESGNSLIMYIITAVPSLGFIGTVRGISSGLGLADQAIAGDIAPMIDKLGVAFNSTLVSLVIGLFLMLFLHLLTNKQDQMVIKTQKSCEDYLLAKLHD